MAWATHNYKTIVSSLSTMGSKLTRSWPSISERTKAPAMRVRLDIVLVTLIYVYIYIYIFIPFPSWSGFLVCPGPLPWPRGVWGGVPGPRVSPPGPRPVPSWGPQPRPSPPARAPCFGGCPGGRSAYTCTHILNR